MAVTLKTIEEIPSNDPYATPELWNATYRDINYNFSQLTLEINQGFVTKSADIYANSTEAAKNDYIHAQGFFSIVHPANYDRSQRVPTTKWVGDRVDEARAGMLSRISNDMQAVVSPVTFAKTMFAGQSHWGTDIDSILRNLKLEGSEFGPTSVPNFSMLRRLGCVHNIGHANGGLSFICFPLMNFFIMIFGTATFPRGGGHAINVPLPIHVDEPFGVMPTPAVSKNFGAVAGSFANNENITLDYPGAANEIRNNGTFCKVVAFGFTSAASLRAVSNKYAASNAKDN